MSASDIVSVHGRRVWDSRGKPTVEAEVTLAGGARGRAIAPAGASTGSGEAVDLRDGGSRFGGADVMNAVANVNGEIAKALAGRDARDQAGVDAALIALDGTPNKARLGANATVATSMAVLHAAAAAAGVPLYAYLLGDRPAVMPTPEIQIFGGGAHAGRRVDIQDFMVVAPKAQKFRAGAGLDRRGLSRGRRHDAARRGACRASPTKAAIGRPSIPTRPRSTLWFAPSSTPASRPATRWRSRSTSPRPNSIATALYRLGAGGARARFRRHGRPC